VLGNLTAAFALGDLNQEWYFFIMTGISALATFSFCFVKKPEITLL
jgi:hypothetical protein